LLALGLVACGDGDDSTSTATDAVAQGQADDGSSGDFVPQEHSDSGGGSQQYRGEGDNTIQDFGEEADSAEREAAAGTLHNYLDARAAGEWAAACENMSKEIVESLDKLAARAKSVKDKSCGGVLGKLLTQEARQSLGADAEAADVGSLRFDGKRAFVIYRGVDDAILAMPMTKEDGTWKVAALAATPLS
jgi:hypothetical protein